MEESKQCLGCRWHGDVYCWHPVFDDQDDLVVSHRRGCRFFDPGKLGVVPAWCPLTGEIKAFGGPNIEAPTKKLAFDWCQCNGFGYLHIQDELIQEIPCYKGTLNPDFCNSVNYDQILYN